MYTDDLKDRINWPAVVTIIIGTFMVALTGSIVNVALPKIMAVFGTSTDSVQWVITAFMMTQGIITAMSGYLGNTFGYKRAFMFGLMLFTLGSFLCGTSINLNMLIISRVLQGVGCGLIVPLGMAMMYKLGPPSQTGMLLAVWGVSAMAAPALGPSLGGYLMEIASWRLLFYMNIPIGLIAILMGNRTLPETVRIPTSHLDKLGIGTICIGLFCLLYALSNGNTRGWSDPLIVVMIFVAIVNLAACVSI